MTQTCQTASFLKLYTLVRRYSQTKKQNHFFAVSNKEAIFSFEEKNRCIFATNCQKDMSIN